MNKAFVFILSLFLLCGCVFTFPAYALIQANSVKVINIFTAETSDDSLTDDTSSDDSKDTDDGTDDSEKENKTKKESGPDDDSEKDKESDNKDSDEDVDNNSSTSDDTSGDSPEDFFKENDQSVSAVDSKKTGDDLMIIFWSVMFIVSCFYAGIVFWQEKRYNRKP